MDGVRWHGAALAALVALVSCASPPRSEAPTTLPDAAAARAAVLTLLAHGAAAWTRGDLADFVSDYAPEATFVTARGVLRGRAEIAAHYAPRFASGAPRDSLFFQDLEVDVLAPDALNALAYYVLQRGDSVVARGPTSLVMRFRGGRWYIVHDHSG